MSNIPCILQCGRVCSKATDAITSIEKWDTLKNNTELWSGLDKFGDVHTSIDWDTGPVGHCVHDTCRLTLCNATKLEQANNRQKKRVVDECQAQSSSTSDISSTAATPSFKRLRSSLGLIHDKNKCVWCCKTESAKHPESKLVLISYDHAWAAFKSHTVALEDELMRDRINCLINYAADQPYALEIRYHHKCWFKYVRNYQRMSEDDKLPHMHNVTLREAQTIFFDNIRTVIFDEHELRSLQSLLRDYSSIVSRYGFPTSGVKSSYIKDILTREFKDKIGFHSRPQRNQSDLVYDTSGSGSYVEAAISSIGVSSEQLVQNVAARLRDDVKSIKLVPWPPRVEELEEEEELPPLVLQLLSALQGKHGVDLSPSTLSLTSLITQYIIKRPTTTAINATVTLHGLTRSKELVDSYYKLGMGISYPNVLLLRDVWTMHDLERCSVCPAEIAEGEPSISIIDNDDFRNDTLTGGGTSHRCNWMFLQREERLVHKHEANTQDEQPRIKHAKTVSDVLTEKASEMQTVMPYRTVKRGEPPIRPKPTTVSSSTEPQRQRSIIHALARADVNGDRPVAAEQNIPSYNGFHAGLNMWQDKSKAYFHTSYNQPPDKSVVKDVMDKLVTIIATKHMPFAFLVGDHPVYVLITLLKAENPSKFSAIVPFLGPFHTQCVMMSAIYKRYKGSELGEVLVAAGVIADGSVDRALKGKHYKRGLRCLRLMYEALMCQLMKENLGPDLADETRENLDILRDTSQSEESRADAHVALENDADLKSLVTNMFTHVEASDMANYWRDFLSMTDALMQNVHAVHICNWDEYVSSLRAMLPWMVAYDNNRYGKWLPDFWAMLTALPADQVAFLRTDFTQSITGNPYSNMAWDMWIECTMNKGSKMKSGWLSILQNEKQLLVHSRNVNNVAQIRAAHNALANRKKTKRKHTECGPKRMREDEQCVQDLVECMHEFDTFPFDTASTTLRTLQSAMPASDELVADFNSAHAAGEKKLTHFLEERVFNKNTSLHAPVPLCKRLTFAKALSKEKPSDELKAKAAEMERSALKAMINLVEGSQLVNLPELLEHRIVEECVPLFNSNGTFRKTQKSMLVQKLSLESVDLQESYIALVDMGMIWRMATPSAEDRRTQDGNPYKWSDYVHKLSSIILARHHNAHRIICVNDPYDTAYSTKDDERDLRVQGNTHVPNTYMKLGDAFPTARMFKTLLCSSSNKGRLQKMICSYLTDLAQSVDVEIVYSVGSHCTNLSTQQPMQNYSFDQSEADTVLFSTYVVLRESGYSGPVVIDATDTDVYVAAALISQQLPGMLCIKRKQETVRCCDMTTDMMADCIVQLHCMTGCDANSGFYGKGKKSVYDQVAKSPVARQQLSRCGDNLALTEEVLEQLFAFTRSIIYGDNKSKTMAEARAAKWRTIKKKSFIRLPPDADSLRQHCLRANYLAYLVRHPSLKHHPSPIGHGWELVGGCCRPVRHTRPALPMHLPAPRPTEEGQEDEEDESDDDDENRVAAVQRGDSSESEDSECSEAGCSDSD
ncbi:U3 small nucleolar RNA-associated protein 10 [Dissostichus eleginoides]|uniref:U3 small nucleolar RNA-associated protein 10 n=3 Tax=Dissostichus eleginoides TaxID=100907 RepID=A0AAD9B7N8_DISEL|nr:U3 small nucleolar RNA-associated protein 10 [Dissostichus eleginoides]